MPQDSLVVMNTAAGRGSNFRGVAVACVMLVKRTMWGKYEKNKNSVLCGGMLIGRVLSLSQECYTK